MISSIDEKFEKRIALLGKCIDSLETMKMLSLITATECDKARTKIVGVRNGLRMALDIINT